jgi:hypothetical protein
VKPPIFEPVWTQCTLEVGRQILKPVRIVTPWRQEYRTATRHLVVDKATVTAWGNSKDKPDWIAKSVDGAQLQWMTSDKGTAYLLSYVVGSDGRFEHYSSPVHVRRLDLETGRWLTNLPAGSTDNKDRPTDGVLRVLAGEGYVALLSRQVEANKTAELNILAYEVTCFRQGKDKPQWSKAFPTTGSRPGPGVYLWAARSPDYADSALNHLAWMGDTLLVCAEAVQPVLCLNRDTGTTIWKLERPWEFERGFIGPSVWSHYLARRGTDPFEDNAEHQSAAARKKDDEKFDCAIVGGPVVVPLSFKRGWLDTHSIFLAVAKGPAGHLSGYVSDCISYEFNDQGKPVSMVKLPYMVRGSQYSVQKDGVVWKCQHETLIRLAVAKRSGGMGFGPGGPDLLTSIPWLRQVARVHPTAWLGADPVADAIAFGQTHAFCVPSGGYLSMREDSVYHFPLSAIDLQHGIDQPCSLHVPFRGKVPLPDSNYSRGHLLEEGDTIHKYGCYLLGLTQLHLDGSHLEITLAQETPRSATTLRFDLSAADAFRPGVTNNVEKDAI